MEGGVNNSGVRVHMKPEEVHDPYSYLEYVFNKYQMHGKPCDHLIPMMLNALGYYDGKEEKQPSQMDA